jgi:hypothetical protein
MAWDPLRAPALGNCFIKGLQWILSVWVDQKITLKLHDLLVSGRLLLCYGEQILKHVYKVKLVNKQVIALMMGHFC